jgi:hypothetical protein
MPVNASAMPFSFAQAIDSSSLTDPLRLEFRCKSSLPIGSPGEFFLSYFVGVILILAGVCLLVNVRIVS